MPDTGEHASRPKPFRIPFWLGAALFTAIAVFFLWEEHRAHILGVIPYILLLLCPLIHLLMHGGHGHGGHGKRQDRHGGHGGEGRAP